MENENPNNTTSTIDEQNNESIGKRSSIKSSTKTSKKNSSSSLSAEDKYNEYISNLFINALEKGTAPWSKPWSAKEMSLLAPLNPESGTKYRGNNELTLVLSNAVQGFNDNRWMTYNQAKACGGNVRTGEKGTPIVIYITEREVPVLDENGKPTLDEEGKIVTEVEELEKPIRKTSYVFNVKQINFPEGHKYNQSLTEDVSKEQEWENLQAVEDLIKNTGAKIYNDSNQAYYQPSTDSIHLPVKDAFKTQEGYYSTALHELSHWTGHSDRLNRPFTGRFGSDGYAREELVAEISSFMLCLNHGIGHNLENHASYVKSWSEDLKENRNEIITATRKAFEAQRYISSFSKKNVLDEDRTYLLVPDNEESFKKVTELGACYDTEQKRWYITPEHDFAKFNEWLPDNKKVITAPTENNSEQIENANVIKTNEAKDPSINKDFDLTRCTEVLKGAIEFVGEASNSEDLTEEERESWSNKMDELIDLANIVKTRLSESRIIDSSESRIVDNAESNSNSTSNSITNTSNTSSTESESKATSTIDITTDDNNQKTDGNEIVVTLTNGKQLSKTIPYGSLYMDSYPDPICGLKDVFPNDYKDIVEVNKIDLSQEKTGQFLFGGCSNLEKLPQLDTSQMTDFSFMFINCTKLKEIPSMDTSKAKNMYNMFQGCTSLETIPKLDTKNVDDFTSMFGYCKSLKNVPELDASNAVGMYSMFGKCESLTKAPTFTNMNYNKIIDVSRMFADCNNLEDVPHIDYDKLQDCQHVRMSEMFDGCDKIFEKYQTVEPVKLQKLVSKSEDNTVEDSIEVNKHSTENETKTKTNEEVVETNEIDNSNNTNNSDNTNITNNETEANSEEQTNVSHPIPPNKTNVTEQRSENPDYFKEGFTTVVTEGDLKIQLNNSSISLTEGKFSTDVKVFLEGEQLKNSVAHTIWTSDILKGDNQLSIFGEALEKLESKGISKNDFQNLYKKATEEYSKGLKEIVTSTPVYKYFDELNKGKVPDPKDLHKGIINLWRYR